MRNGSKQATNYPQTPNAGSNLDDQKKATKGKKAAVGVEKVERNDTQLVLLTDWLIDWYKVYYSVLSNACSEVQNKQYTKFIFNSVSILAQEHNKTSLAKYALPLRAQAWMRWLMWWIVQLMGSDKNWIFTKGDTAVYN